MAQSYAELTNAVKTMIAGLNTHGERLSKRGIDAAFITEMQANWQKALDLDNEQEDMKAQLKQKTSLLDERMTTLRGMLSEAKKVVKLEMEKESWKSFGMQDKR